MYFEIACLLTYVFIIQGFRKELNTQTCAALQLGVVWTSGLPPVLELPINFPDFGAWKL